MLTTFKGNFLEQRAYKAGVSLVLSKEESMSRGRRLRSHSSETGA